ncbi:MAG: LPXTG cell wall anchor domain-containing protein [Clostridium sp.]
MYENTLEGNETTSQKGFAIPTNVEVPGIPEVKPEVKPEIKPSKSLPKTGSVVSSGILSAIGVVSAGVGFYLNKKKKNK